MQFVYNLVLKVKLNNFVLKVIDNQRKIIYNFSIKSNDS